MHQRHGIEVPPRSSPRALRVRRAIASREIAARRGHTPDQAAGDGGALNAIEAEVREDRIDAQPVHGGTRGFHAGGPGRMSCNEADRPRRR